MKALLQVLDNNGSFAKPFVNYYESVGLPSGWRSYIQTIKLAWSRRYFKALKCLETALIKTRKNGILYYLILSKKMSILHFLGQEEATVIYDKLRKEFSRIPTFLRSAVASNLLNVYARTADNPKMKKFRFWSDSYKKDQSGWCFFLLGKARDFTKKGDVVKAKRLFQECIEESLKADHPIAIATAYNDAAWYLRSTYPEDSINYARKAGYLNGKYRESPASALPSIDTLIEVEKDFVSKEVVNLEVFAGCMKCVPKEMENHIRKRYAHRMILLPKILTDLKKSLYENDMELREWLSKNISSIKQTSLLSGVARDHLSKLINGKTQTVRGETLRKIITGLRIEVDPLNDPYPVVNEWIKIQIDKGFENAITELEKLKPSEREILILSTYTALLNRRKDYPYLSRKGTLLRALELCKGDLLRFKEFTENRYETKKFVAQLFELHPFLEGRRDLVWKFLKALPARKRKEFIHKYLQLGDKDRGVIDTFMRNYVRYDRNWGLRPKPPAELYPFTQKYRLKKTQTALA
ncbi:hypothetical protein DU53_12080, partial [Kosmotoga sp. DU53]